MKVLLAVQVVEEPVESNWRSFALPRYKDKYSWIDFRDNGIFCRSMKEKSSKFITVPFTGRLSFDAVQAVFEQEGSTGDATALGC